VFPHLGAKVSSFFNVFLLCTDKESNKNELNLEKKSYKFLQKDADSAVFMAKYSEIGRIKHV
jgi:hypothetical protein